MPEPLPRSLRALMLELDIETDNLASAIRAKRTRLIREARQKIVENLVANAQRRAVKLKSRQ